MQNSNMKTEKEILKDCLDESGVVHATVKKYPEFEAAIIEAMKIYASQKWIPVSERPLITLDTKGNWTCTVDGDRGFIAAVPLSDDNWWIRHCVIEDRIGLCIVGDIDNEPAGYDILDITHWQPLPPKPKQ